MSKHIGIVACSAEGAALCYRTICLEAAQYMGEHFHPEITMHTHSLGEYMEFIYQNNWDGVAKLMISSSKKLKDAGAEFAVCPDNTIHEVFEQVTNESPIPWLHIAEVVGQNAKKNKYRKLGILGTKYLMEGPVYSTTLEKFELEYEIPERDDRLNINEKIFNELVNGILKDNTRNYFNDVINKLKQNSCDAVVLGCTEIPLIVDPAKSPLPTLDSTRLLARAALAKALE